MNLTGALNDTLKDSGIHLGAKSKDSKTNWNMNIDSIDGSCATLALLD